MKKETCLHVELPTAFSGQKEIDLFPPSVSFQSTSLYRREGHRFTMGREVVTFFSSSSSSIVLSIDTSSVATVVVEGEVVAGIHLFRYGNEID